MQGSLENNREPDRRRTNHPAFVTDTRVVCFFLFSIGVVIPPRFRYRRFTRIAADLHVFCFLFFCYDSFYRIACVDILLSRPRVRGRYVRSRDPRLGPIRTARFGRDHVSRNSDSDDDDGLHVCTEISGLDQSPFIDPVGRKVTDHRRSVTVRIDCVHCVLTVRRRIRRGRSSRVIYIVIITHLHYCRWTLSSAPDRVQGPCGTWWGWKKIVIIRREYFRRPRGRRGFSFFISTLILDRLHGLINIFPKSYKFFFFFFYTVIPRVKPDPPGRLCFAYFIRHGGGSLIENRAKLCAFLVD